VPPVLVMAPANVLHGAVRLHGFASSPTPETHVRAACASAGRPPAAIARLAATLAKATLQEVMNDN